MPATFPTKLGRYQIVKHLANGGMAQVLLARATGIEGFERHVVVKRIHQNRAEDPVFVKMFLDEARLAAQLHHNNIVQVHDIGKEKGEYFFAMEYVHGEDLRKLLMTVNKKKEKVPFEHVVTIVTTAALALHHAHEQRGADRKPLGLVHRDVSPANIIVGYDGNVKVVDFGIAKAALRTTEDTKAGSLKGKVAYMSPEQCAGLSVDRRGDVYSLGIVLFELSTVRRLFKGNNDFLTMSSIVQGNIPKPSSYRADIPAELEGIILKALSIEAADRYQSADEMREALEAFAATKGLRTSTGALAGYMKQLFGHRPEPWLVDDTPAELELSVDFDGEATGAAPVPEGDGVPSLVEPTPSSPIQRARNKAATSANALNRTSAVAGAAAKPRPQLPPPSIGRKTPPAFPVPAARATPPVPFPAVKPAKVEASKVEELQQAKAALANLRLETVQPDDDEEHTSTLDVRIEPLVPKPPILPVALETQDKPPKDDGWTNGSPTTGSGTPLAWTADVTATSASSPKKKLFAISGVLLAGIAAAAFLVMRGGGDAEDHTPPPPTPAKSVTPAPQIVEPPPPPPVPADAAEPAQEAGAGSGSDVDAGSAVAAGSGSAEVKKPLKRKKPPKEQWNPDELFLPEDKK
ncbi:MAG: protein kinase [Myxococcota bacterium]|nr:protein kinase [Myxococcota bacterium]